MDISPHIIDRINRFLIREYRADLDSLSIIKTNDENNELGIMLQGNDKQYPGFIRIIKSKNGRTPEIIPYHLVREKHNRQIASFWIGKGISNLAGIIEISGSIFSRYAPSYSLNELPHQDAGKSKIGLWMHDCLTEDFDHNPAINRATLSTGVVISYDFGMAFSHPYFPPFYSFELDIGEETIMKERVFIIELLSKYARRRLTPEKEYIARVARSFSSIISPDLCRYYYRNYQAYFFKRIRLSRFFEKIRHTPFSKKEVEKLLHLLDMPVDRMNSWDDIQKRLSKLSGNRLDLRGLNLSGADLRKARLMGADLREVNLRGADLRHANLKGSNLKGADLREADLRGAKVDTDSLKEALI